MVGNSNTFFFSFAEMIDIIIETIGITDRRIEGHLMIGNGNIITQVDVGLLHPTQEVPQEGMYSIQTASGQVFPNDRRFMI